MTYVIDIHPLLTNVTFETEDCFGDSLIRGNYVSYPIKLIPADLVRVEKFVREHGNDMLDNEFTFIGHCNGYAMNISYVHYKLDDTISVTINTYRPYGQYGPIQFFEKDKMDVCMKKTVFDQLKESGDLHSYIL